jgi:hypothetical protein
VREQVFSYNQSEKEADPVFDQGLVDILENLLTKYKDKFTDFNDWSFFTNQPTSTGKVPSYAEARKRLNEMDEFEEIIYEEYGLAVLAREGYSLSEAKAALSLGLRVPLAYLDEESWNRALLGGGNRCIDRRYWAWSTGEASDIK